MVGKVTSNKTIVLVCFILLNTACMVGPDFEEPAPPCTEAYTETPIAKETITANQKKGMGPEGPDTNGSGESQKYICDRDIEGDWWHLFGSYPLNELVHRGLEKNHNLEAALAALNMARANYQGSMGPLFPQLTLQLLGERTRFSGSSIGAQNFSEVFSLYNAQININYVFDIWGGTRRNMEALCAYSENQRYLYESSYITLTANIVNAAIQDASLREQIKATRDLIALQENTLKIVKGQFELGGASKADILLQETQLASLIATLPPLETRLAQNRHALAALVGEFPSETCLPQFHLSQLKLPRELPVKIPSELVRQRPDIQAAEALLHQASAQIGVAIANMLPQVSINTSYYGYEGDLLRELFTPHNVLWNYGGELLQPIFQGWSLYFKKKAAYAAFEKACAQYRQSVVAAFQNVADTLRALEDDARTLKAQINAEIAARESYLLSDQQYKLGAIHFLTLLIAERQYQQAKLNRIQAEAQRYTDTAALFLALGGGWWNRNCAPCLPYYTKRCERCLE